IVVVAACANPPPSPPPETGLRLITIGADAVSALPVGLEILGRQDDYAYAAVEAGDLEALSDQMHERFHRCGGYMVEDALDDVELRHDAQLDGIDYRLDRAPIVQAVLPALDKAAILRTSGELSAMRNR